MVEVISFPPIPANELLKRIRDDLCNLYNRESLEIKKATVCIQENKKVSGAKALQELGTIMYNLGCQVDGKL